MGDGTVFRVTTLVSVLIVGLSLVVTGCGSKSAESGDRKSYIVVYKKVQKNSAFKNVESVEVKSFALSEAHEISGPKQIFSAALQGGVFELSEAEALRVSQDESVAYVEEDGLVHTTAVQNNPTWGLDRVDQAALPLNKKYSYVDGGSTVNVYVIDTGIRISHEDFQGRAKSGADLVDRDNSADDCNGHGTHVAGTIAGRNFGVAKNVTLHAVRVLDCAGSGRISDVIAGVEWVTQNHKKPAVANMSLGGGASQALDDAVRNSIQSGVTYAVAAGNNNGNACSGSPGRVSEAITVGSTTKADRRSDFSNHGSCVDIFAPGSEITSAWSNTDSANKTIDGTSMASPHVAGVVALYLGQNPSATPSQAALAVLQNASSNRLSDVKAGSPNRLLNSSFVVQNPGGGGGPVPVPSDGSLRSGDLVNSISGAKSSQAKYKIKTSQGGGKLVVKIFGGTGDADLYVKSASAPDLNSYECRPYLVGNTETCEISGIASGEYHILIHGYDSFAKVSLKVEILGAASPNEPCVQCVLEVGQLAGSGHFQLHPKGNYYQSNKTETHSVFLRAGLDIDFDVSLKKWDGFKWVAVATSASPGGEETLSYQGEPGFYTIEVRSFLGAGAYKVYRKQGD